jgi:hypothetical protein
MVSSIESERASERERERDRETRSPPLPLVSNLTPGIDNRQPYAQGTTCDASNSSTMLWFQSESSTTVGLYKLNPVVTHSLKAPGFHDPLSL